VTALMCSRCSLNGRTRAAVRSGFCRDCLIAAVTPKPSRIPDVRMAEALPDLTSAELEQRRQLGEAGAKRVMQQARERMETYFAARADGDGEEQAARAARVAPGGKTAKKYEREWQASLAAAAEEVA